LAINSGERDRSVRSPLSIQIQRWRGSSAKEDILFENCTWINKPSRWHLASGALSVVTDSKTDFWRETHYGFVRHNGHCFGYRTSGDFTATIRVRGRYRELYDQAGMMVLLDEQTWIKAGIEYSDGRAALSSVLTIGKSDWATAAFAGDPGDFWVRATMARGALRVQVSSDGAV
jgi:uncharacterized protein